MQGLILIDKPEGLTSFGVVAKLKWLCGTKRVGHTGTLDPLATGVLPILVGRPTVLCGHLLAADKEYIASVRLGVTTDTLDITGKVLEQRAVAVTKEQINAVLKTFVGKQKQTPPMYSALKKDGVRLYDLARQGKEVDRPVRDIEIFEIELLSFTKDGFDMRVLCSKGTYIRSLADDIGKVLGTGAVLRALRRTKTAGFSVQDSVRLDDLTPENVRIFLQPAETAVLSYPACVVSSKQAIRFQNGGELALSRVNGLKNAPDGALYRIKEADRFLGLGRVDRASESLKIECLTWHITDRETD